MKALQPWVSDLGIPQASYDLWMRDLPKNQTFTFWCLSTARINTEKYLAWAQERYGLPILQSAFFKTAPNFAFWKNIQSVANWSAEMVPVQEWDGVVFIACVEPHTEVQWSFPVQYVLASAQDLKTYWASLQSEPAVASPPPLAPEVSTVMAIVPENSASELTIQPFAVKPIEKSEPPPFMADVQIEIEPPTTIAELDTPLPSAATSSTPAADEPEGLNLSQLASLTSTSNKVDLMDQLSNQVKASTANVDLNAPDNLSWSDSGPSDAASMPDGLVGATTPASAHAPVTPPKPILAPVIAVAKPAAVAPLDSESTPAPEIVAFNSETPPPPSEEKTLGGTEVLVFQQKPAAAPASATTDSASGPTPPMSGADFVEFLLQLKNHFLGGMVLWTQNDLFKPVSWDEAFKPTSPKAENFWSLNPPSAFRIAYRTKMPYLGHVVPTPANQEFFQAWGFAEMPKSVLIQPVTVEGSITYLLVAIADPEKKSQHLLVAGEKMGQALALVKPKFKAA